MKIRSLLLGSVAAAGLSTGGAYAADLGVLTSLDICDSLGLSGLTISSDTNCLQITGEVKYAFSWGDYSGDSDTYISTMDDAWDADADDGAPDWNSRFDAWIKFVATAESDFGPAKAVIKIKRTDQKEYTASAFTQASGFTASSSGTFVTAVTAPVVTSVSEDASGTITNVGTAAGYVTAQGSTSIGSASSASFAGTFASYGSGSSTDGVIFDEAYVSIGDSTVIMAGKKGSILNDGDDEPLNWLGLFNSDDVDAGVGASVDIDDGGHVIQVTSDLGNGFSVKAGLENLDGSDYSTGYWTTTDQVSGADNPAGTFVGVMEYAGDGISAHVSFEADGVLAMDIQDWFVHAGFAGTFDNFKVVLAGAFDSEEYFNVLASASATFDMFTIAGSVEAAGTDGDMDFGAGASISAAVTDGVTLNLGGRWYHNDSIDADSYEVAAQVEAAVTETITVTGKVGYVSSEESDSDLFYGSGKLAWAPGGGFTSSLEGKLNSDGAYKITSEFKKTFE
jgi:hypothetical protein